MCSTSTLHSSSTDKTLNLDSLLIQLQHINSRWYHLGDTLGVPTATLDEINTQCTADQCMTEMLDAWLRTHTSHPTWKEVAGALRQMQQHQLANALDQVYVTG